MEHDEETEMGRRSSEVYRILGMGSGAGAGAGEWYGSGFSSCSSLEMSEVAQARALAASKNHREAEKRRRERINAHLNNLRALLPCNSKTDKASLLGKVIEHVKELKQRSAEIEEAELIPSPTDDITVHSLSSSSSVVLKASVCCEDRSDLLPDLIHTLKSLNLKAVRAEMATLGGRIRNVLLLTSTSSSSSSFAQPPPPREALEEEEYELREALKNLIDPTDLRSKRRRVLESAPTCTPGPI